MPMKAYGTEFFSIFDMNRLRLLHDLINQRHTIRLATRRLEICDRYCHHLLDRYSRMDRFDLLTVAAGNPVIAN